MKTSWKKVMMIAVPVLVVAGGAGYAMTGGSTETAEGASNASNVSAQVVSSQTLSAAEASQLGNAKPAPVIANASATTSAVESPTSTAASVDQATLDANNPFVMQTAPEPTTSASVPAAIPPAPVASNFQVNQVKNMAFETNTTQGKLEVVFKQEGGTFKLEGDLGGRKLDVQGEQALQIMNQLLTGYQLQDALTATLQGKQVQLDPKVLDAISTLNIELQDGRKIESKGAQGKKPKEEGKHDNGKHNGQDKQEEQGKGKKHD